MTPSPAPFTFATAAAVVFGVGTSRDLPARVAALGARPLVCVGRSPGRLGSLLDEIPGDCELVEVAGEPTVELTDAVTARAREAAVDVVVGIGGGSVLDLGKAVAALLGNGGSALDHVEGVGAGRPLSAPALPYLAVPTTAGTGAEVTANAVLTAGRVKVSMRSPHMLPRVALVDPSLALSSPPGVTASSGLDALTQCLEPFVSPYANPLTDSFAVEGLRRASRGLRAAYEDGSDLTARSDLALCALFGGLALANAKLGAVHGLAGVVGGMTGAPHGMVCAALLAPVMSANVRALREREPDNPALERYDQVAALLTGRSDAPAEAGIDWVRQTVALLDISGLTLTDADAATAVPLAMRSSSMRGNPVVLTEQELMTVLVEAR